MKIKTWLSGIFFLVIIFNNRINAQYIYPGENEPPKLIVGIVIENMRPDYIDRYWDKFQDNGFKKIFSNGLVYTNFKLEQHIQSYATGTATLFTGVYPATHGIINEEWYDRLKKKEVNCVSDDYYFTVGADTEAGNTSPNNLLANTIGDNLKIFTRGKSKVFSVALNDASAIFSAGHAADGAYWFDPESGRMISSSFYLNMFPDWVRIFNSRGLADIYTHRNWVTLLPFEEYTESVEDNYLFEKGYYEQWKTFPHIINQYVKRAENYNPIKTTPFGNSIVSEFASLLILNEQVGTDNFTDLVTVVFSSMDYEYGSFGPVSMEMEDLYLRLDQDIANFIDQLENKFGNDVLIFLTANTSASYPVEYLKGEFNLAADNFSPESRFSLLTSYLNITYGEEKWTENIIGQQIYLNHDLIEKYNIDPDKIIEKTADFINQFEGVKVVLTSQELQKGYSGSNSVYSAIYNSYYKTRSGDLCYMLEDGWQPVYKYYNVNYTDQSHIPLVLYGKNIQPGIIKNRYLGIDLVPTICELINIPIPDKCQGKIMEGINP